MFTGWKPAPCTRASAASRLATLNVMWCGPALEELPRHAVAVLRARPPLRGAEPDRMAAEDQGPAERAGKELQRLGRVDRGEGNMVEVVCGGHGGGRLCCAGRTREKGRG